MKRLFILLAAIFAFASANADDYIRILAIGNSFSVDVVEQNLHELAKAQGKTLVIGSLFIGGCTLEKHWKNIRSAKRAYSYRKIAANGQKVQITKRVKYSIQAAFDDEQWDYIMLQQQSGLSGVKSSFDKYLPELTGKVRELAKKEAKLILMQTWAYQGDATHNQFAIYDYDQTKMYKAIVKAYGKVFKNKDYGFHALVPNGTAIQNGRTYFSDKLTRDGYHLNKKIGRYIGACTLCEVLIGESVVGHSYRPKGVSEEDALAAQKAAHAAILRPNKITRIK